MKRLAAILFVALAAVAGGVYYWQGSVARSAQTQVSQTERQLTATQKQLSSATAAATIDTKDWKQYCDSQTKLCFRYPQNWKVQDESSATAGITSKRLTNPAGTVTVRYTSPLAKDSGAYSSHIVSAKDLRVGTTSLRLIGAYPVAAGGLQPSYTMYAYNDASTLTANQLGLETSNATFTVGQASNIQLTAYRTKADLKTPAQAEAWFQTPEAKTASYIVGTLTAQ